MCQSAPCDNQELLQGGDLTVIQSTDAEAEVNMEADTLHKVLVRQACAFLAIFEPADRPKSWDA